MYDQIPTKELSTVLKSMGYNPTKEEIQDMVDQVRFDLTGGCDYKKGKKCDLKDSAKLFS